MILQYHYITVVVKRIVTRADNAAEALRRQTVNRADGWLRGGGSLRAGGVAGAAQRVTKHGARAGVAGGSSQAALLRRTLAVAVGSSLDHVLSFIFIDMANCQSN
jgi:hypothetical protein